MNFSQRMRGLTQSPIRKLFPLANLAEKNGNKVFYLNIGQPDLATPKGFLDAVRKFDASTISYAPTRGTEPLLNAVKSYFRRNNIFLEENDLLITSGGSEALLFALTILCDVGDEVLIPEPFYVNTGFFIDQLNIHKVVIPTSEVNGYHLPSQKDIEKLITPKTKAIIMTNPNNPTGTVYYKEEIETIKNIALKYDIFVIADEVYSKIVFAPATFHSFGHLDDLSQHLVIVDSVSKRYSACGARIGVLVSKNKEFIGEAMKLASSRLSVATINQVGATALYNMPEGDFTSVSDEYYRRRNAVVSELKKIKGISFHVPEGAFYMLITLPFSDAEEFAKWALTDFAYQKQTVFVAPAKDFYLCKERGKSQIRIAFVYEEKTLREAIKTLGAAIKAYPNK